MKDTNIKIRTYLAENLHNQSLYNATLQKLTPKRREMIEKYKPLNSKLLSAAAGLLLYEAFKDYTGDKDDCTMPEPSYSEHGKPYIKEYPQFKFNLSHSGSYAAISYGSSESGIDIQIDSDINDSVAKRIFSVNEYEEYTSSDNKHLLANKAWCIKEAYIKLIGTGLLYDMRNCSIEYTTADSGKVFDSTGEYPAASFSYSAIVNNELVHHLAVCEEL